MGKFKVGDKVRLRKHSLYYGLDGQIPIGSYGVVTEQERQNPRFPYEVSWGNVGYNQYGEDDLERAVSFKGNIK